MISILLISRPMSPIAVISFVHGVRLLAAGLIVLIAHGSPRTHTRNVPVLPGIPGTALVHPDLLALVHLLAHVLRVLASLVSLLPAARAGVHRDHRHVYRSP